MKKYRNFVSEGEFKGFENLENRILVGIEKNDLQEVISAHMDGADIDFNEGYPMICAASTGKYDIVEYFLDEETKFKDKGLYYASANGRTEVMKLLLEDGADPNYLNGGTITWALQKNQLESVKLLLKYKARLDGLDKKYVKPMDIAIDNGNFPMAKLLIDYGCDITETQIKKAQKSNYLIYEYLKNIIDTAHGLKTTPTRVTKPPLKVEHKGDFFNFTEFERIVIDNFGKHRIKKKNYKFENDKYTVTFIISCNYDSDYYVTETYNVIKEEIRPNMGKFCKGYEMKAEAYAIDDTEIEASFAFTKTPTKPKRDINKFNLYKLSVGGNSLTVYPYLIEEILDEQFDFQCSYFSYSNQQKNIVFMYDNEQYEWDKLNKVRKFLYDHFVYLSKIELNLQEPYLVLHFLIVDPLSVVTM